jgi:hypothetical protein
VGVGGSSALGIVRTRLGLLPPFSDRPPRSAPGELPEWHTSHPRLVKMSTMSVEKEMFLGNTGPPSVTVRMARLTTFDADGVCGALMPVAARTVDRAV